MGSVQKFALVVLLLLILTGCASIPSIQDRQPDTPALVDRTPEQKDNTVPIIVANREGTVPLPNPEPPKPAPPEPAPPAAQPTPLAVPANLATSANGWGYNLNKTHTAPEIPSKLSKWLSQYHGYYVHNPAAKAVYLTFDEGYENGFTPKILDTLNKNGVKATFFVTKSFITNNPLLVNRMVNEGHIVANHTVTHRSMNLLSEQEIQTELQDVEVAFKAVTGKNISKYIRPPSGEFSERSLWVSDKLGYKTVFWSIAYKDWDTANQPSQQQALSLIENNHHNGAIILLHAVSKTNTDNLEEMLGILRSNGYSFKLINEI